MSNTERIEIQAPITVEIMVSITNGKTKGVATVVARHGKYPTESEMRALVASLGEGKGIPEGWRLMTKREWWDNWCEANFGKHFALPGGPEFDA